MSNPSGSANRGRFSLTSQILLLQLALIAATLAVGAYVSLRFTRAQLDEQYGERSLAIAESVGATPAVRAAFSDADPSRTIQPIAEAVRRATGATFVVVGNPDGIRYSHPNPANIGHRVSTDPGPALAGQSYVAIETGTLGRSVRGKTPIVQDDGAVIGFVSVGILTEEISAQLRRDLPQFLTWLGVAVLLGVLGSVLLARRIKRQTFGLEPEEIARLLENREAVLHGIREGVLVLDAGGTLTLANDEASRLLGLGVDAVDRPAEDVLPPGRLREVTLGGTDVADQVVVAGERVLVVNRMTVSVRGERVGSVVTLRDRTELEGLLRELASVRSLADGLRAQAHEFSNRLHTIAGLVELGRHTDAVRFIAQQTEVQQLSDSLMTSVGEPTVTALLLAKSAVASERGIALRVDPSSHVAEDLPHAEDLITVVGNLLDNAFEALGPAGGVVEVLVRSDGDGTTVRVSDEGPGVHPDLVQEIFRDGFSTKGSDGRSRGLGLALLRQVVDRHGGTVEVHNDGGAVFVVRIPARAGVPT